MFCENCGNKIEDKAKFCYNCGEKVNYTDTTTVKSENSIKQNGSCPKCGHTIEDNAKFCDYCGEMVTHNNAVAAEAVSNFSYEKAQLEDSVKQNVSCPKCGHTIEDKSKFCDYCGEMVTHNDAVAAEPINSFSYEKAQLEDLVKQNEKCSKCGHTIEENSKFCDYCGEMVTHNDAVAAEAVSNFSYEKTQSENSVKQNGNCSKCGHIIEGNSTFCDYCGTPIDSTPKKISGVTPKQNFAATGTPYGNTSVRTNIKKPIIIILIIFILLIVGTVGILFVYNNHKEKTITSTTHQNIVEKDVQTEAITEKSVTTKATTAKTTVKTTTKAVAEAESDEETYSITIEAEEILEEAGVKLGGHVGIAVLSNLTCSDGDAVINTEKIHIYDNLVSVTVTDITAESVTLSGTITTYGINNLDGQTISYPDTSGVFLIKKAVAGEAAEKEQIANSYVGKWECQELKADGLTLSGVFNGIPVAVMFQMELRKDGTGTIMMIDEDSEKLNWQADGDTVSVEVEGETVKFEKDGNRIVASEVIDGSKTVITLVKVDRFTEYENDIIITSNPVNNMRGQINCHGGTVSGFTTDYVVNGGAVGKVRNSLGDTWHVTAKNTCYNYGVEWYELWDSDDGDYYGWVDSSYIDFY